METVKKSLYKSVKRGSKEEADYVRSLRKDIMDSDAKYVDMAQKELDYQADAKEYHEMSDKEKANFAKRGRMDIFNQMYNRQVAMMCVMPLMSGVSVEKIMQCAGVYIGYSMINHDFRKDVKKTIGEVLTPYMTSLAEKDPRFATYRDKCIKMANDGRMPLTANSAAIMKIGYMQQVNYDLRQPDANEEQIMNDYNGAIRALYRQAQDDGVDLDDINSYERHVIGHMLKENPELAVHFEQTRGMFGVKCSEGTIRSIDITNPDGTITKHKEKQWVDEMQTPDGDDFTGTFTPARVRSKEEYIDELTDDFMMMNHIQKMAELGGFNTDEFQQERNERLKAMYNLYRVEMDCDGIADSMKIIDEVKNYVDTVQAKAWEDTSPETVKAYQRNADVFREQYDMLAKEAKENHTTMDYEKLWNQYIGSSYLARQRNPDLYYSSFQPQTNTNKTQQSEPKSESKNRPKPKSYKKNNGGQSQMDNQFE